MKNNFLVEIGTEDLPSKYLKSIAKSFYESIQYEMTIASVKYEKIRWFATYRRFAIQTKLHYFIISKNCITKQKIKNVNIFNSSKKKSLYVNKKKLNIHIFEDIDIKDNLYCKYNVIKDKDMANNLLYRIIMTSLKKMFIPKKMQWSNTNTQFVRPIHTVTALLNDIVITGKIFSIKIDRYILSGSYGKRKLLKLDNANNYESSLLKKSNIIVDFYKRKKLITELINIELNKLKGKITNNASLLEESTALVEYPDIIVGSFEKKFLTLPGAVIKNILYTQKCFPIYDKYNNKILPYFICIIHAKKNYQKNIQYEYENVINPRLLDAEFFLNLDKKNKLEDRFNTLKYMLFQEKLGSLQEKTIRIQSLSVWISDKIHGNTKNISRAAFLSKCDLATQMVFEYPNTQGIMGEYYANFDGESEEVAIAQREHYYPNSTNSILPTLLTSQTISISDKIDNIVGIFGLKLYPTGKKDPFGLKRSALGVIRICIEKKISLNLETLIQKSIILYQKNTIDINTKREVMNFIFQRLHLWYANNKYNAGIVKSILSIKEKKNNLLDLHQKIYVLTDFLKCKRSFVILSSYKRLFNILKKYSSIKTYSLFNKKNLDTFQNKLDIANKYENNLFILKNKILKFLISDNYYDALVILKKLSEELNVYLDNVKIFSDQEVLKNKRINFLIQINSCYLKIADFSFLI
ncbi:MAG: glycine--tRNA ligase subunit beta [Wigglesworthia glossinidia]|nr:glycine--tRNA ligase subunit beta [Wigglesworthia glossinidia]